MLIVIAWEHLSLDYARNLASSSLKSEYLNLYLFFFFSSRRRHTRSVSAFLLNRSSDLLKSGVNHTSRGSISTSTLPSIKLRKCSSKIITSILSFISGRLATKSNQIKQLIRNGRSASLQRTFKKSF